MIGPLPSQFQSAIVTDFPPLEVEFFGFESFRAEADDLIVGLMRLVSDIQRTVKCELRDVPILRRSNTLYLRSNDFQSEMQFETDSKEKCVKANRTRRKLTERRWRLKIEKRRRFSHIFL
jgi:hypothetical protein